MGINISNEILFWRKFAFSKRTKPHIDAILGKYKSDEFRSIVIKWIGSLRNKKVFKTDLREEAYGEDEILFSLPGKNLNIFAVDIAEETTRKAYLIQKEKGLTQNYITADVRGLPFRNNVFDIILSSSTLDHFTSEDDFLKSIFELKRVMKPGGSLIITINNRCNYNFYLTLKLEKLLSLKSYPVQSYSPNKLRKIFKAVGLHIQEDEAIVHIISPMNSVLLLLRRFIDKEKVDKMAKSCVSFARWLGRKKTKLLTGWFIALKCVKNI